MRLDDYLAQATVDRAVFDLRPDYRVTLLAADGIVPGPSDDDGEALIERAEAFAREATAKDPVEELPHIAAWREAYRAFGAKPQRTRNSLEALTRRAATTELPRVNRLTDLYNALSVLHQIPLGGEDLGHYVGPPRLVRAVGDEPFDTAASGEDVVEHPEPGEVVWRDDAGVTCRRWNWRQCRRTALRDETTSVIFVLDALGPMTDAALGAVADALRESLLRLGAHVRTADRTLALR